MLEWIKRNKYWCSSLLAMIPAALVVGFVSSTADAKSNAIDDATAYLQNLADSMGVDEA
jgi:hypothetical protein